MNKTFVRIIGFLVIAAAFVPGALSYHFYQKNRIFIEHAVLTNAELTDNHHSESDDGSSYYPIYTYYDEDGNTHKKQSSVGRNTPGTLGDKVALYYDPQQPDSAKFNTFWSLWLLPLLFGIITVIPLFIGIGVSIIIPMFISNSLHEQQIVSDVPLHHSDTRVKTWAVVTHIASFSFLLGIPFGNIFGPLTVWLIKRDENEFIDFHGRSAINFQLTITLLGFVSLFLCLVLVGFILLPGVILTSIIFTIIAAKHADEGKYYIYPFSFQFLKTSPLSQKGDSTVV